MNRMKIDLRSDTVTRPGLAMRKAMAEAEVGDDVYGEDPTINLLQERAAELCGKDAAIFLPSGTMGNQIALLVHSKRGSEVLVETRSHILDYEMGGPAVFSGVILRAVPGRKGILDPLDVKAGLRSGGSPLNLRTSLVAVENTHNMAGGTITPPEVGDAICAVAHAQGIPVHLDGARIFNAAVALGVSVSSLVRAFDSVMFCLSKGLAAPVGSMLVGSAEFIEEARIWRKRLGGGMRQAGILAAAGLVALDESPAQLEKDHLNARALASAAAGVPGLGIDLATVQTNIVIVDVSGAGRSAGEFSGSLSDLGVLANSINQREIRFVTHCDVSTADIETAIEAIRTVAAKGTPASRV